jgi:hypothetical protein
MKERRTHRPVFCMMEDMREYSYHLRDLGVDKRIK